MTTLDGRYVIVFNGEIYNFVELRKELELQGQQFRGHSDTEVLLCLYVRHGLEALKKINGMFAFAIYDKVGRRLILVRDRLGVKPLFCWREGRAFGFASELPALRSLPNFPSSINNEALALFFRLGAVPEWSCLFPGVIKLPPGSWLEYHIETGVGIGPNQYWDLPPVREEEGRSEEEWVDEIESLLWDATRIRLRADVPLGVFLSGGIDSGLVAAAAGKQRSGLTSMTVGFAGEQEDETALALACARHLGLRPSRRNLDLPEGLAALPRTMAHFDEPFADTSALPTSMVCAEARKNFTVVLSGDGGDEVFGGYQNHVRAWRWRRLELVPLQWRRSAGNLLSSLLPRNTLPERFFRRLGQPVGRFGMGGKHYLFEDSLRECLKPELCIDPSYVAALYDSNLPRWSGTSSLDLAQRTDLRSYMLDDILVKVDRMSMLHSLEVRSPFLDYRMVELGLRIPSRLRVKNGRNKYLLRRLAIRHLPIAVCQAPKRGFGIPIRSWLQDGPNALAVAEILGANHNGCPDPFLQGGAARLWRLASASSSATSLLVRVLCYRWWCMQCN